MNWNNAKKIVNKTSKSLIYSLAAMHTGALLISSGPALFCYWATRDETRIIPSLSFEEFQKTLRKLNPGWEPWKESHDELFGQDDEDDDDDDSEDEWKKKHDNLYGNKDD